MTTLTGFVASVVVHSSAAAFAHFGLSIQPANVDRPATPPPAAQHVVARVKSASQKVAACPDRGRRAHLDKV